jgi:hypothetical protein
MHATSHAQEAPHRSVSQLCAPAQVMSHGPPVQVTLWQLCADMQAIVQSPSQTSVAHWLRLFSQATTHGPARQPNRASWQAPSPWHWTSQPTGEQSTSTGVPIVP